jgi:hypothetical protein
MLGLEQIVAGLARCDETEAVVLTGAGSQFFSMRILDPMVRPTSPTGNIYRDSSIGVAKCAACDDPGSHIAYQFPDGRILRFNGQSEEECPSR